MIYKKFLTVSLVFILTFSFRYSFNSLAYGSVKTNIFLSNKESKYQDIYTAKVCIQGIWWLITYSSDGYIINIVEDDE